MEVQFNCFLATTTPLGLGVNYSSMLHSCVLLLQLYNFEDKGGRRVVLRPEITPSLARLVIKQGWVCLLPILHS